MTRSTSAENGIGQRLTGTAVALGSVVAYAEKGIFMDREQLLQKLAQSSFDGELGLFVGTGVSIALTADSFIRVAPTFDELLRRCSEELDLDFPDDVGESYPQIASGLVRQLADRDFGSKRNPHASRKEASLRFKEVVARLCHLAAEDAARDWFSKALYQIRPAWVVTTNYDLLFDGVVPRSSVLLPGQLMPTRRRTTPVYHIHGHRNDPESIVVAEEDYVEMLGPNQYRQLKLSLLFSESTTLVLGYALRDINVLSAMKWAEFHQQGATANDRQVVQALWKEEGIEKPDPYVGPYGQWIVEIDSIAGLLSELADAVDLLAQDRCKAEDELWELMKDDDVLKLARTDSLRRKKLFRLLRDCNSEPITGTLARLLDPVWKKARKDHGWRHYDTFVDIVIEAFMVWPTSAHDPGVFSYLRGRLELVARYMSLDPKPGDAYAASRTWNGRKSALDPRTIHELEAVASDGYSNLEDLFRRKRSRRQRVRRRQAGA